MTGRNPEADAPLVSVIMGTYNEEDSIASCLNALLNQQNFDLKRMEILIADGGSVDGTRVILDRYREAHPQIHWFDNPSRIATAGWNLCLDHAMGDVIVLLGGHTVVADDFISANLKMLDEAPDAGCVGGRVETAAKGYLQQAFAAALTSPFGVGNARYRYSAKSQYVETVAYGAYRKILFEEVGRFNENLTRNGDWEFNYRVGQAGYRLFFSPEIRSTYNPRSSFGRLWSQQYQTAASKVAVIRRYPGSILWRHVIPSLFVVCLIGGWVLGLVSQPVFYLWLLMLCTYGSVSLIASASLCRKHGWRYLPILPVIFLWMHLSYGSGLIGGALDYARRRRTEIDRR